MLKLILHRINKFFAGIFPFAIKVEGKWIYYDSLDRLAAVLLWKFNLLEKHELKLFQSFLKPGMVILDIGANMGIYSILATKVLNGSGQIIAFEPDKQHFETISKSINKNKIQNIVLYNKAVGNKEQYLSLKIDPLNSGNYQLRRQKSEGPETNLEELVEVVSLDYFLKDIPQIDLVKMDIQGFEYFALQGMKELIQKNDQCIIFCEYWPKGLNENMVTPFEFIELIASFKLMIFIFDKNINKLTKISAEELINMDNSISYKNIILSKKELIT